LRDGCHVHHLFVAEACHRQGIAGRLWRTLLARTSAPEVTVNASVYAAPVYARWGFVATQPPQQRMGLAYVPMRWLRTA
jgi:GNAT superfamily N-acetyltransferase